MSDAQLFMLRAELDQPSLIRFAIRSGLPPRVDDDGYTLHAVLRALFGDAAPQPFVAHGGRGRALTLLGYGGADHRELGERARALADPLASAALDFASMCSKPMPSAWRAGTDYRFRTRVCPVVRISGRSAGEAPREIDAFLHRCLRVGKDVAVDRETVYREWLAAQLDRAGAASLREMRMERFARRRLARRDRSHARAHITRCERPDATLCGTVEVRSPEGFAALIRRGLGRHRAFGFGMLLLSH